MLTARRPTCCSALCCRQRKKQKFSTLQGAVDELGKKDDVIAQLEADLERMKGTQVLVQVRVARWQQGGRGLWVAAAARRAV